MDIATSFPLKVGRMHQVYGPAAQSFAAVCAAGANAPFFWIREDWRAEQLNPAGFAEFFAPKNLLVASTKSQTDTLASAEEALRSGTVPLVVMELNSPLDLTAGRRLQLAAKTGKSTAVAIIPEGMGSHAAETRWHCSPVYDPGDSTLQCWTLKKNKSGTLGVWNVRWSASSRRINVVPEAGV